ncbi:serine/threonine-protein phosphatase 4 regulatory subunit 2 [Nasonia vitripennis]|uniref:Serine/threonine-protein phosphatase 4 regulatory subunit 2 n=1 Tax=Nasonia vitripennis TaxID=7425 RepID=A0A7M7GIS0_NASVI|nr:serine/threonine-protein phosphatase 4 regulatory subunit 2 [Nasonia vitripennis]XP_016840756.1 serine/threonine-protein phosphatase 4 regulatory subunit 2 [Nasonia vitripennis]
MENPEEVLQALDEFQKMRPSEIPRELEDYLCWVARTGDPVYQWSLIKALFREKLLRVMTEFYESCPSLDLTPCPNVEQFNYDIMKSNLLERLESFANAPFTVQRICELLTTPRKEYNRIDKFMRAIEKNILVVSTREPGPYGRRSENGDSMVNGSVEDETSHHGQTSNDVEVENWVKDCTTTAAATSHAGENEEMSVENGVKTALNTTFDKEDTIEAPHSVVDSTASSFVPSSTEFNPVTTMPVQALPVQEAASEVQNLTTTVNQEATATVNDVSDAMINEDTSSQPSLELESDDNDSSDSKKLQTTFQAKDFTAEEDKTVKTYSEVLKTGKPEESIDTAEPSKESNQLMQSTMSNERLLNDNSSDSQSSDKADNLEDVAQSSESETNQDEASPAVEEPVSEKSEAESNICSDNFLLENSNSSVKNDSEDVVPESSEPQVEAKVDTEVKDECETKAAAKEADVSPADSSENSDKDTSEKTELNDVSEVAKPIIEEPPIELADTSSVTKPESSEITIEETTEDEETKASKAIVPDPIPIVEEPKDGESTAEDWNSSVSVTEVASESKDPASTIKNGLAEPVITSDQVEDNKMVVAGCEEAPSKGPSESMDVDNEEISDGEVLQDEPMEQELTEAMNS